MANMMRVVSTKDDETGVLLYALGPKIGGQRKPSVFRIRTDGRKFYIDNKHGTGTLGRWRALGESTDYVASIDAMTQLNDRELAKHGLSQW